jgi:hypothetical protein
MKTLEDQVREHFEQTVRTGQPVSGISIPAATSRGLSLLRRRRARLVLQG